MPRSPREDRPNGSDTPTFAEFSKWAVGKGRNEIHNRYNGLNVVFNHPYFANCDLRRMFGGHCRFCGVDYDAVGKMETAEEDFKHGKHRT